jgi:hypothetical protein
MIIFINGSFGVGKTTVAENLLRAIPNSLLYDPEEIGLMLGNILKPIDWSGDFQDYPMWRVLLVEVAKLLNHRYQRKLIMPMTIWREDYFKEVLSRLRTIDSDVHHFCLIANADVISDRIRRRGEQGEGDWIYDQIEKCIPSFKSDLFKEKIDTTFASPEQITQQILQLTNTLDPVGN